MENRVLSLPGLGVGLCLFCVGYKLIQRGVQPSMTGASYCCHVTLLILLLTLRFTVATINTPSISSSSSPQSWSSSSSSLSQSSSLATSQSTSATILSTVGITQIRVSPVTIGRSTADAPPSPSASQSSNLLLNNGQSPNSISTSSLTSDSILSFRTMQSTTSTTTQDQTHQREVTKDLDISKSRKFHLTASKEDRKKLKSIEKLFLNTLGLSKRPRISTQYAVPEYMLDLYNIHSQHSNRRHRYMQVKGNGAIAANTVRSFLHAESSEQQQQHTCQPPLCTRVFFDITSIPETETVTGAELRIFAGAPDTLPGSAGKTPQPPSSSAAVDSKYSAPAGNPAYRLEVHEIMRAASLDGEVISRLLDTQVVSTSNSTWHSFDIRPAVLRWKRAGSHNHGLEIRLVGKSSSPSPHNHIRLRRSAHLQEKEWAMQRPLLVAYTNDGSSPSSYSKSSSPKSKQMTRLKRNKRQTPEDERKNNKRNRRKNKKKQRRKKKGNKNVCKRHGLYVDFNEVGWNDWIVAPSGFAAYYCHGDCMAPLPQFTKASAHAMLQARVYKVSPNTVPMVCCVPTTMTGISLLYMDEKGRTVLRNYQDMVVTECSCQ